MFGKIDHCCILPLTFCVPTVQRSNFRCKRSRFAAVVLDGMVYAIGGDNGNERLNVVERFPGHMLTLKGHIFTTQTKHFLRVVELGPRKLVASCFFGCPCNVYKVGPGTLFLTSLRRSNNGQQKGFITVQKHQRTIFCFSRPSLIF